MWPEVDGFLNANICYDSVVAFPLLKAKLHPILNCMRVCCYGFVKPTY